MESDASVWGLDLQEMPSPEVVLVHQNLWDALLLYFDCQTQWRVSSQGYLLGLDYRSVDIAIKYKLPKNKRKKCFAVLQRIETAIIRHEINNAS